MLLPVTLSGKHVRLEPLALDHAGPLLAAAIEDRSTFNFTTVPADDDAMHAYVLDALKEHEAGEALPFAIVDAPASRVMGTTRFLDIEYWPDAEAGIPSVVEIGNTWLAASAQRTPINTEAKLLLLTHAFETWRVHRVCLKTDARNERSRRAIERIGAQFEGIRRAHKPATGGGIRDSAYYSIIAYEWPQVRRALARRVENR